MRAFVIAMECEAECVRPHLKSDDRLYVAGIGKVNAAAATQRAICEGADEIWNAGLCGGFGDDIEVGAVEDSVFQGRRDLDLVAAIVNGVAFQSDFVCRLLYGALNGGVVECWHCTCFEFRTVEGI